MRSHAPSPPCPRHPAGPSARRPAPTRARHLLAIALLVACCLALVSTASAQEERGETASPGADAQLALVQGIVALEQGDAAAAVGHLEEATRLDPGSGEAAYWLGLALLENGQPEDAADAFDAALDADDPAPVAEADVREARELAREAARLDGTEDAAARLPRPGLGPDLVVLGRAPFFDGRLSVAVGNDSNPLLIPDDAPLVFFDPDGGVLDGPESDGVGLADLRLALRPVRRDGFVLEVVGRVDGAVYQDFSSLDQHGAEVTVQAVFGRDPLSWVPGAFDWSATAPGKDRVVVLLQAGLRRDWIDGETAADTTRAGATVRLHQGGWGSLDLVGQYRDLEIENDPGGVFSTSREEISGRALQTLYLGSRDRWLRLGIGVGERDAGAAFDASWEEVLVEASLPLGERVALLVDGGLRREEYDDERSTVPFIVFAPTLREDEILRAGASLVWALAERLRLTGRVSWSDREIDLGMDAGVPFDYGWDRTLATLGLTWTFGSGDPDGGDR